MRAMLERRQAELDAGAAPLGWKIGINVEAVQERLGITAPLVGYMTTDSLLEPGAEMDVSDWTNAVLEPELAIRVGGDGEIAAFAPAIELVDIVLPFDDVEPILGCNIFHRAVCLGAERVGASTDGLGCRVIVDGSEAAAGELAEDPPDTVAHVAQLLTAHGAELAAGEWIIAGSITPPLPVPSGSEVEVELSGLGSVGLPFS